MSQTVKYPHSEMCRLCFNFHSFLPKLINIVTLAGIVQSIMRIANKNNGQIAFAFKPNYFVG
jgi:hypothetical protein